MDFLGGGDFTDPADPDAGGYSGGGFVERWLDCSISSLPSKVNVSSPPDFFDAQNSSVVTETLSRHELSIIAPANAIRESVISIEKPSNAILESPRVFQASVSETSNIVVHAASRDYSLPVKWNYTKSIAPAYSAIPGTAMAAAIQNVDSRLVTGKTKFRWTSRGDDNGGWTKNPNFWAVDYNFAPLSPWNNSAGYLWAGTLISPCHVAISQHIEGYFPGGQIMIWIAPDGTIIKRTTGAKLRANFNGDLTIIKLTEDVPSSLGFFKVLPRDFENFLPSLALNRYTTTGFYNPKVFIPIVTFDQEDKGVVRNLRGLRGDGFEHDNPPTGNTLRTPFTETIVGGDSSDASFLLFNEPVFLGCSHYPSGGTFISGNTRPNSNYALGSNALDGPVPSVYDSTNGAMAALGGGYQLTPYDLSSFPSYDTDSYLTNLNPPQFPEY